MLTQNFNKDLNFGTHAYWEILPLKEIITQVVIQQSIGDLNDDVTKYVGKGLGKFMEIKGMIDLEDNMMMLLERAISLWR